MRSLCAAYTVLCGLLDYSLTVHRLQTAIHKFFQANLDRHLAQADTQVDCPTKENRENNRLVQNAVQNGLYRDLC